MGGGWLTSARMGAVSLSVTSLDRATGFYQGILGLTPRVRDGWTDLATPSGEVLLRLVERRELRAPSAGPGLFHVAFLVPSRRELGRALLGFEAAGWPLHGASDHAVSEALYLADPDGHGIEIYADRPREVWRMVGDELHMVTERLDVRGLLRETGDAPGPWAGLPAGAVVGHVHLRVRDLDAAERVFAQDLGMGVTVRSYPGARFFAAGGYHHHVGANTWWRRGGEVDAAGRVGLDSFELQVPPGAFERVAERVERAGGSREGEHALRLRGPDGGYSVTVRAGG